VAICFVAKWLQEFSFITHDRPMVSPNMQKRNQLQNPKSICHSAPMLSKKEQNVKTSLPMSSPQNTGHGTLGTNWKVILHRQLEGLNHLNHRFNVKRSKRQCPTPLFKLKRSTLIDVERSKLTNAIILDLMTWTL